VVCADTEDQSDGAGLTLYCEIGETGEKWNCDSPAAALERIKELSPREYWFFNTDYDLNNIFVEDRHKVLLTRLYHGSRLTSASDCWGNRYFDLARFFPGAPLRKIGELVGLDKFPFAPDSLDYCFRDCEIVRAGLALVRTLTQSRGISGAAFKEWKNFYPFQFKKHSPWIMKMLRESYRGGRIETYKEGLMMGKIEQYDLKSAYPWAGLSALPVPYSFHHVPSTKINEWTLCRIQVEIPDTCFCPPLGIRGKAGKVFYPTGTVSGWFWGAEFIGLPFPVKILDAVQWDHETICKDFFNWALALRRESQGLMAEYYKRLANSLTGRFGLRNSGRVIRGENPGDKEDSRAWLNGRGLAMIIWDEENYQSPVEIVSYITAVVRRRLWDNLYKNGEDILYCHTDSIMGFAPLEVDSLELSGVGQFEKCMEGFSLDLRGPGLYNLDGKVRGRGVKNPARAMADGFDEWRAPVRSIAAFRGGVKANDWIENRREISGGYQGRVFADGTSRPFQVRELEL